jgi:23S rRNA (guanosine2251-2'-O)-methyltransferase
MAKSKPDHRRHSSSSQSGGGNRLWLYGDHAVRAALANPNRTCHRLAVSGETPSPLPAGLTAEKMGRAGLEALLPRGAVHQGVALHVSRLPRRDIEALEAPAGRRAVAVMLDQVTDPQNVGAVLRSAAAFGAAGVIVQDRHAPEETGALAKAASGALEAVPLIRTGNLSRALDELKESGWWAVGLDQDGSTSLEAIDHERVILVLGAEGSGMRRLVREHCDLVAAIPMRKSAIASLNVSNAAAIALYVVTRAAR